LSTYFYAVLYIDATVLIEIAVNRMGNKVRLVSNIGSFSIYELPKYALFIRIRIGLGVSCLFYREGAQTAHFVCIEHIS
jgi:hypothetical protein